MRQPITKARKHSSNIIRPHISGEVGQLPQNDQQTGSGNEANHHRIGDKTSQATKTEEPKRHLEESDQ